MSVSTFIARTLDDALKRMAPRSSPPFRLVTVKGEGLHPEIELDRPRALVAEDDEALLAASILSGVAFGLGHFCQDRRQAVKIIFVGFVFVLFYVGTGINHPAFQLLRSHVPELTPDVRKNRVSQGSWGWLVRTCVSLEGAGPCVRIHLVSYPRFVVAL